MKVFGKTPGPKIALGMNGGVCGRLEVESLTDMNKCRVVWSFCPNKGCDDAISNADFGHRYVSLLTAEECLGMAMALLEARTRILEAMEHQEVGELETL